ncbi:MerR family transcriptional regulator [Nonomuraea sp. FMUSA5-5]|uniref:MerR family transcriptional regulator n=1 Tax=Nonomuraea composti TaxID=2720023 RepID=A0ABX1ATR2_9ACTN|nr:TioE family transcriptional regulator [Nonomuraea sp. FMUSA5-5]NJP89020.1 MerR family transcriptional regulator [Nonomuraea sp. FMUSA5-5]
MPRGRLRPVDLAREHGLSTQAVRNYEEAGILPASARTEHGYRTYTARHAQALRAFLALVPAHGHATATSIMRAANEGATEEALRLIDESHAQLLEDRRTLEAVEQALRSLVPPPAPSAEPSRAPSAEPSRAPSAEPAYGPSPTPSRGPSPAPKAEPGVTFIGPLARKLGIRPATLRKWEQAGLVEPRRDPATGYRVYSAADVRDAQLAHQLRRGGYLLEQIAPLIRQVRAAGGLAPLESALRDWQERLSARGRAMLRGAAALHTYLDEQE